MLVHAIFEGKNSSQLLSRLQGQKEIYPKIDRQDSINLYAFLDAINNLNNARFLPFDRVQV